MNKFVVIGFGIFCVVVVAALVFALTRPSEEAGLVQVCDDGNYVVHYSPPAECQTIDLVWPKEQFPLAVWSGNDNGALRVAINDMNNILGFDAFQISSYSDSEVNVEFNVPYEAKWREVEGTVEHTQDDSRMSAYVRISNVPDVATMHTVLLHELGHVLGLAHDDFEGSLMFPQIGSGHLTDHDRALLRKLYSE